MGGKGSNACSAPPVHVHSLLLHSLFRLLSQEGDQVVPILGLLQTSESHLRARDVFLGVFEVLEKRVFAPDHVRLLVRVGVGKALYGASVATEQAVEVRPDLVAFAFLQCVALRAPRLKEVGALLGVTIREALLAHCGLKSLPQETF